MVVGPVRLGLGAFRTNEKEKHVMYAYSWYQMFAIMLVAGVAIFIILRSLDMALQWFLDRMLARRDRKENARGA